VNAPFLALGGRLLGSAAAATASFPATAAGRLIAGVGLRAAFRAAAGAESGGG
jgi:hypothetical protein